MGTRVTGFEDAWAAASTIPGWLTRAQAAVLFSEASAVGHGRVVEIGSHLGRSTVVLASTGAPVTAIDPFLGHWRYGTDSTESEYRSHLAACGVQELVDTRVATSADVLAGWSGDVALVYVDGKHDYWSCRHDLGWAAHLPLHGHVLVHDGFSSVGVTAALLRTLLPRRATMRMLDRTGSLVRLEQGVPGWNDRLRVLAQLPWFLRNVVVKVLLRARLRPLARMIGHGDTADPY